MRLPLWAMLASLLGACSCGEDVEPERVLEIVSPLDGAELNRADDLDPGREGVQVEARLRAKNLDGASVTLVALEGDIGEVTAAKIESGAARVVFTLGSAVRIAARAELAGKRFESRPVTYAFDASPRVCRFLAPADGAELGPDDDESPLEGFQVTARVRCTGIELGNPLELSLGGAPLGQAPLSAGGIATFERVDLAEGSNVLESRIAGNQGEIVTARATVTVVTGACRVLIHPPTGTVFNARGEGDHPSVVADLEPGPPMQARIRVDADCPGSTILLRRDGAVIADGVAGDGPLEFPVTLDDGELSLRAVAAGERQGASPTVRYLVDAVVPEATLTFPAGGEAFGDRDDRSDAPGLQILARGRFTGIGAGAPFEVVLRTGEDGETIFTGELDDQEQFQLPITLPDGEHSLFVRAARASGTTANSRTASFRSTFLSASVAIQSPLDGETFALSRDANPSAAGYQVRFTMAATQLDGAGGVVNCGGVVAPFAVAGGTATATVTFNPQGCGGAVYTCRARIPIEGGGFFESARVRIVVDPVPPQPVLIAPEDGDILSSNLVTVSATTSCRNEVQQAILLHGIERIAGPIPVVDNAVVFEQVVLPSGESRLGLLVTDAAGNETELPFSVYVDADAPEVRFVEPDPSDAVVFGPADDESGTLEDGLQRTMTVEVDNESIGTLVELRVGDRRAAGARTELVDGRRVATFTGISLPEGISQLLACAVDEAGNVGCAELSVLVSTGRPICNVTWPRDGSALGGRDDQAPGEEGVTTDLVVATDAPVGTPVSISVSGPNGPFESTVAATAGDGFNEARISGHVFPVEGEYVVQAVCGAEPPGHSLPNEVVVDFTPPLVEMLRPEEGELFNLDSPDRSAAPGFHIDVKLRSDKPALGGLAFLSVDCGQGDQELPPLQLNSLGEATFRAVLLPDEAACTLTGRVEDSAGNQSDPLVRFIRVDRVAPSVTITAPQDGALFGQSHDANSQTPEFELSQAVALVSDAGRPVATELRIGDRLIEGGSTVVLNPPAGTQTRSTWVMVPLEEGGNDLVVTAVDEAGNTASRTHQVTVDTRAPTVSITSHISGQVLSSLADIDASTPGLQQNIRLTGEKLNNGTLVQICSPQGTSQTQCSGGGAQLATALLGSGDAIVPTVTLPEGAIVIYAVATDVAGNTAQSANVSLTVDSVPPVVEALGLFRTGGEGEVELDTANGTAVFGAGADSSTAPGFQTRLRAQLSGVEPGRGLQARFVTANPVPGTVLGSAPIDDQGRVMLDVTLAEGGHRIHVLAHDAAGNPTSTPERPLPLPPVLLNFAVDMTPPSIAIVRPLPGKLLVKDDLDPMTPGIQAAIEIDSDAGPGRSVQLLLGGEPFASLSLPLTGRRATVVATFPDGNAVLSAHVSDPAGNVATSAPVALLVDSIPPIVAIDTPAPGANLGGPGGTPDADPDLPGFQADVRVSYGQMEAGQPIVLLSSAGGVLQSTTATSDDGGQRLMRVTLPGGEQSLRARAIDVSGNVTESSPVHVVVDAGGPSVTFVRTENPLLFGASDNQGGGATCRVSLGASTDAESGSIELLVDGLPGGSAPVTGGAATLTDIELPVNTTVELQLRATDGEGRLGYSAPRQALCDLTLPTVAFTDPAPGSVIKYVAFGNPGNVTGARADKLPTQQLEADFTVQVGDAEGGSLTLSSDLDGELASREVTAAGTVTISLADVAIASRGRHVLTATARSAAGNERTATLEIDVDVLTPAPVTAGVSVLDPRLTLVNLMFAAPGDDGTSGARVAGYVVRRASTPIDSEAAWAAATPQAFQSAEIVAPGATQVLLVEGLAFEREYHFAVRATDAIGNLAPLGGSTTVDLQLRRQHVAVPMSSNALQLKLVVADLDGDGNDDIISSSASAESGRGQVAIFYGGSPTLGAPVLLTGLPGATLGWSVAVGDVDGDGQVDLLVSAPRETAPGSVAGARDGAVHVFFGAPNARLSSCTFGAETGGCLPGATLYGSIEASDSPTGITAGLGVQIAIVDDLDGDGVSDVVVGSPYELGRRGRAFVFSGGEAWSTPRTVADALATITSEFVVNSGPLFGLRLENVGDLDGDGYGDFAATAGLGTFAAGDNRHRPAYVISGRLARGDVPAERISAILQRSDITPDTLTASQFGYDLATGDFNGDGVLDLAVTDPMDGGTVLFSGAAIGPHLPQEALASGSNVTNVTHFGRPRIPVTGGATVVYRLGDVNGDGIDDFAVTKASTPHLNEAHVWFGRQSGAWTSTAELILRRRDVSKEAGGFGGAVASGHVTGRDHRDIVVVDFGGGATVLSDR